MHATAPSLPPALLDLQAATRAARARGHVSLATAIKAGRVQLVTVTYDADGRSTVTVLSDHPSLAAATAAINALPALPGHLEVGQCVRFAAPANPREALQRFEVVELRGDRVLVRFICDMVLKPTLVYPTADMVADF